VVIIAAAKVGGILNNNVNRAQFIYENTTIQNNLIHGSYISKAKKLIFLGSSCIYPKLSKQPMKEEYLLSGKLEETNEPYAIAKIHGVKMCESYNKQYNTNFISLMPSSLYGSNDNYNLQNSHVIPALLKKIFLAKTKKKKTLKIWGSGKPKREFLCVDDLAKFVVRIISLNPKKKLINVGYGKEISIGKLAFMIKKIIGYTGKITFDKQKPDGVKRKLLDSKYAKTLGFKVKTNLEDGLRKTFKEKFLK
jgi:GDP-L-fucose synthase